MDVTQLKLKTVSKLNDEDKTYIREHSDEFTDEDKAAWSEAIDLPATEGGEPAVTNEPEPVTPAPEPTPAPAATPPAYQFGSEEEAKEFVRKEFESQKQAAVDAAATPQEKKWVEDNWKPKNWNEGIKTTAEAAADILQERQRAEATKIEEHNKKVAAEWQSLRTEHKLEDVTTEAGLKVHDAIVELGIKFGKKNFKDAYEVYMMVPKEKGGGFEATPATPTPPTPSEAAAILAKSKTDKTADAKKIAAKVGGQNPGAGSVKGNGSIKPITYEDMKTKSKTKLIREALAG